MLQVNVMILNLVKTVHVYILQHLEFHFLVPMETALLAQESVLMAQQPLLLVVPPLGLLVLVVPVLVLPMVLVVLLLMVSSLLLLQLNALLVEVNPFLFTDGTGQYGSLRRWSLPNGLIVCLGDPSMSLSNHSIWENWKTCSRKRLERL